jgi:fatty-acyl-CoA synthase
VTARTTFIDELRRHAEQTPNAAALSDPHGRLSYRELWDEIRSTAGWLRANGVRPGDRVAFALPGGVANVVVMFAAMASGAVAAPLNTSLRRRELSDYLGPIRPALLIVSPQFRAAIDPGLAGSVLDLGVHDGTLDSLAVLDRPEPDRVAVDPDPAAPAIMFGTGGTTGVPKAAVWSHGGLWLYASSCATAMEVRCTDVELFFSPQFHIALVTGPFGTLFCGGAVHLLPRFDAADVAHALVHEGITRFFGAPTALLRVMEHPVFDAARMGRVRRVLYGSTRSEPDLPQRLARAFPAAEFVTGYGATEFGAVIRLRSWETAAAGPGRDLGVGRPVPGVNILIVGRDGALLPPGSVGELVVQAPWQMLGYWHGDRSETFLYDGVRSGDLGDRDEDGYVHLRGRSKDVVITGGENVFPVEVEDVLSAHPAVAEVSIVGIIDREWGERVEAAVVLMPAVVASAAELAEELTAYCHERLAGYKVPKRIHFVERLPLTGTMKVDKQALREVLADA